MNPSHRDPFSFPDAIQTKGWSKDASIVPSISKFYILDGTRRPVGHPIECNAENSTPNEDLLPNQQICGSKLGDSPYTGRQAVAPEFNMTITKTTRKQGLDLARVLIADDHPASRLTLQTVLEAGGYQVDTAATAAEAVGKLDTDEYALVLTEMAMETPNSGLKVIAHAKMMDYKPATAFLKTDLNSSADRRQMTDFLVAPENLPEFFAQVAALISDRATRLVNRQVRQAHAN